MFANERQDQIYDMIQKNGAVTTSMLVNFLVCPLKRFAEICCQWNKTED